MVVWWLGGGRRGSRWEGGQHGESISHAGQNEAEDQNWTFFRRSERWLKRLQEPCDPGLHVVVSGKGIDR